MTFINPIANNPTATWDQVAKELRQHREAQHEQWGDIDDITIGKYAAGEATPEETREVESAMATYPRVREAVEIVKKVLSGK